MIVQTQRWPGKTRVIIMQSTEVGTASVQLEIFDSPLNMDGFKAPSLIWGLWVDEPLRRKGYATRLMNKAEDIAREYNCESVFLEWSIKESPIEIFHWYERRCYDEKAFSTGENANSLMKKELKKTAQ